jgi:hypothetical protein
MQFLCPICKTAVVPGDLSPDDSLACPRCKIGLKMPSEAACAESQAAHERLKAKLVSLGFPPIPEPPTNLVLADPAKHAQQAKKKKVLACLLLIGCLASWFLPWGVIVATLLAVKKGHSLCAYPGCTKAAELQVGYSRAGLLDLGKPEYNVGYCAEHAGQAAKSLTIRRDRRDLVTWVRFFLAILPLVFVPVYIYVLVRVFRDKYKAFRDFCWLTVAGVAANPLAYSFWVYSSWGLML